MKLKEDKIYQKKPNSFIFSRKRTEFVYPNRRIKQEKKKERSTRKGAK